MELLDAYFDRIKYGGATTSNLETLSAIVRAHVCNIPFENLDILLNRPIGLQPENLTDKLIAQKRGGYCFEQNGLLLLVLEALGFSVRPLSARVRVGRERDYLPARTHLFLKVSLGGNEWFADVGVGGLSPTAPVLMKLNHEQESPHENRRIVYEAGFYFHQALLGDTWQDVYEFTLEEMPFVDREVGNWWTSTGPSRFRTLLTCAIANADGTRFTMLDDRFIHRRGAEILELIHVESSRQRLEILRSKFGLCFPEGTEFRWPLPPYSPG